MGRDRFGIQPRGQSPRPLQWLKRNVFLDDDGFLLGGGTETERRLAPADHFNINFGEQLGVEKSAVFRAVRDTLDKSEKSQRRSA